jgi:hypothetical protein
MSLELYPKEKKEEEEDHSFWDCPMCGAPQSEWDISCGCYEDIHYGD